MTRNEILTEIRKFFDIEEFACDHLLEYYSTNPDRCWDFKDTAQLANVLVIRRDILQVPMYCNNHKKGQHQRGLRCNLCELVRSKDRPYMSGHVLGKGDDFTVEGMTAQEAREKIKKNAHLLPFPLRMEADVNWLHIDSMPTPSGQKVYEFKSK